MPTVQKTKITFKVYLEIGVRKMDITSQAVELLKAKYFKSYQVFPEDTQGMIDFDALSNTKPRWVKFKRARVDNIQINSNSICFKGATLWDDSGNQVEKDFECVIGLPISLDSPIQFF